MSPDEISTCNVTTSPFYDSTSREKLALLEALRPFKSRRSVVLRAISPLTPWSDDEAKPKTRRKNLHKTKAQGKLKNGLATKENAKGRKDLREYVRSCQRKNDQLPSEDKHVARGSFLHHSDISQYMREYRELRKRIAAGHRDCTCHGTYGLQEIMKAYESLGLPKQQNRCQTSCRPETILSEQEKNSPASSADKHPATGSDAADEDSGLEERALASPEARERRNNLNLTPVRKHIRLPDVSHYPVQAVSGLGMKELVRIATAREESRQAENAPGGGSPPRLYYSMPEKKIPQLSVRAQEKEMCRVVELALPNKSHEEQEPTASRRDAECQAPERGSSQMRDGVLPVEETNRWSRLAKLPERDEDVLTMALGTSRSCQSSVLSHVISPLSMTSSTASARKGAHTVREMLTASVRDLQPFRCNGTACRVAPLAGEGPCTGPLRDAEAAAQNPKQVVSLQTFKNLARRPTMRKFLHELYTPEISPSPLGAKLNHCSISGKPLGKLPSPGDVDSDDDKAAQRAAKLADAATQDSVCATRLLKRVRQRQMAAEAYESIRRAVAADEHSNRPKLAILSKCDTVVKPRVTLRGGAV